MIVDILTTFPEMFRGPFDESILKRAQEAERVRIQIRNLRDWTHDRHHKTDDEQYGGGDGMVMLAEPVIEAVESIQQEEDAPVHVVATTPQGRRFTQPVAEELAQKARLLFICGHYKGMDERVFDILQPDEISIGDYILTGGEPAVMVMVDAIVRLIPGVVSSFGSVEGDSFSCGLLDSPRYTRPREIRGHEVPPVLLSGHHAQIEKWRLEQSIERTRERRPDLHEAWVRSRDDSSAS